jgi:hypothetical protein
LPGDYQFGKRGPACGGCSREFEVGEEYHSALSIEVVEAQPPGEGAGPAEEEASADESPAEASESQPEDAPALASEAVAADGGSADGGLPFRRVDLCSDCWNAEAAGEYFCFWKSEVPDEEEREKPLAKRIDIETTYDMFRRLEGHADPAQQKFRFILALMLMRKKRLKFTGVVDSPHGEHLVLDDKDEGVTHKVLDPGLAEDEVDSLRGQIDQLLGGSGEPETEAESEAETEAPAVPLAGGE